MDNSQAPDFESIKQLNLSGDEYWRARELAPLLGFNQWRRFEGAIQRAMEACAGNNQAVANHFVATERMIRSGKATERAFPDYLLSRYACYLIALNGDPRKPEIAAAQNYFVVTTREHEMARLLEEQENRLELRELVAGNNRNLAQAAAAAGVPPAGFGRFHNAGYSGLYAGLDVAGIKTRKGIAPKEDILDRMGRAELAANDFRITQTEEKLRNEPITEEAAAIETHYNVGKEVRQAQWGAVGGLVGGRAGRRVC